MPKDVPGRDRPGRRARAHRLLARPCRTDATIPRQKPRERRGCGRVTGVWRGSVARMRRSRARRPRGLSGPGGPRPPASGAAASHGCDDPAPEAPEGSGGVRPGAPIRHLRVTWRLPVGHAVDVMAVGRFAPSPTGDLHVGNLRTALVAWLFARSAGSRFVVRMEDLDRVTSSRELARRQLDDLRALGLDWDGEVVVPVRPVRPLRGGDRPASPPRA